MAAYSRVYDSRHLQADCQEPGWISSGTLCLAIEYGLPLLFYWRRVRKRAYRVWERCRAWLCCELARRHVTRPPPYIACSPALPWRASPPPSPSHRARPSRGAERHLLAATWPHRAHRLHNTTTPHSQHAVHDAYRKKRELKLRDKVICMHRLKSMVTVRSPCCGYNTM